MKILSVGLLSVAMMSSASAHAPSADSDATKIKATVAQKVSAPTSRTQVAGEMVCDQNNKDQCK